MVRSITARKGLDKRWYSTAKVGEYIYLMGYCVPYLPLNKDICAALKMQYDKQREIKLEQNKDKYHYTGHDTREEANRCYYEYILDIELKHIQTPDWQGSTKCYICKSHTNTGIEPQPGVFYWLCEKHNTNETIEKIIPFIPDMIILKND